MGNGRQCSIGGVYDTERVEVEEQWKFKKVVLRLKLLSSFTDGWVKPPTATVFLSLDLTLRFFNEEEEV